MGASDEFPDTLKSASVFGQAASVPFELPQGRYNAATYFVDRHLKEGRGGKVAFIDHRGSYTYRELALRVNRAGRMLLDLGVEPEQRVMLCLLDEMYMPAAFWGAIKIGAVPVAVNTFVAPADYAYMLRDSRARALVVSASLLDRLRPALAEKNYLKAVVVAGGAGNGPPPGFSSFDKLCSEAGEDLEAAETVADDVGFWVYSSGSTGEPKGVVHLHSDLYPTAQLYAAQVLGLQESDVVFSAAKLFFAYGLGNAMTFPLHVGATSVLMAERPTPEAVMRVMKQHRPTIFFGVPTLYASILADPVLDLSRSSDRLRLCISAAEPLPEHISRRWKERFGVEILDGIGSTELLHIYISNRLNDLRYGSSGKPVPGYEMRVLDETGRQVDEGEVGDLWCRGPSVSPYYWNKRELSARTFFGRWMRTGDKYVRLPGGYYQYAGRSDDMLKVGGIWVSPAEVESALASHSDVLEAAVVEHRDADGLVKPKAFIVLKPGVKASLDLADTLKAFVKSSLAPYKYPRWIEFCPELPKTASGKIQRFKLRAGA